MLELKCIYPDATAAKQQSRRRNSARQQQLDEAKQQSPQNGPRTAETVEEQPPASVSSNDPFAHFQNSDRWHHPGLADDNAMMDKPNSTSTAKENCDHGPSNMSMFFNDHSSVDDSIIPYLDIGIDQSLIDSPVALDTIDHGRLDFSLDSSEFLFISSNMPIPGTSKSRRVSRSSSVNLISDPFKPPTPPSATVSSSEGFSRSACRCLQCVVFLMEELESRLSAAPAEGLDSLDSALASNKEAVRYGESMLACLLCSARRENMTILTFLTDRLVVLCERIVATYTELRSALVQQAQGRRNVLRPWEGISNDMGYRKVFLGDYEIDSPVEWDILLRDLIRLQLSALSSLVGGVIKHTQWKKLVTTKEKINGLLQKVR